MISNNFDFNFQYMVRAVGMGISFRWNYCDHELSPHEKRADKDIQCICNQFLRPGSFDMRRKTHMRLILIYLYYCISTVFSKSEKLKYKS